MTATTDDIWLNGAFRPAAGAIAANDRGLLLADGVFDTALVLGGRVFRGADHLQRLAAACAALKLPVSTARLEEAMAALAARCCEGSIRLTVTRGPAPRGLGLPAAPHPTVFGSFAPLVPAMMFRPVSLVTTKIRRNETSPAARLKSLAYLDAVMATDEAKAKGADDALFLNTAGRLASTGLANVFVADGTKLSTPSLGEGVLAGITRKWILEHADALGLTVEAAPITPAMAADRSLFVANSLRLIAPVTALDGAALPRSEVVAVLAAKLSEAIAAECGRDPRECGASLDALQPRG
ncbi:aminotransferase class IV [Jiella pacifica]|uniref:Probable branched-chain-amino-acid aminotransferase n=1 Tax=Jiella pacifica TaxID=2696469 RepID=A0A6N9TA81_9HYPH|nr:aminotransferase class IV [Jiella pacifica]NDW05818.1 class IV aminotransferase [Jiella pacifica]